MINLDSITNENNKKYDEKCLYIFGHPYRILIIGGSESGKTNLSLNLIKNEIIMMLLTRSICMQKI